MLNRKQDGAKDGIRASVESQTYVLQTTVGYTTVYLWWPGREEHVNPPGGGAERESQKQVAREVKEKWILQTEITCQSVKINTILEMGISSEKKKVNGRKRENAVTLLKCKDETILE